MLVPGSRTDRSRALGALTLVLAAFALWASAATGSTYAIVASTNVQTTTLANDVLPDLGSYTELQLRSIGAAAVFRKPFRLAEVARVLGELANKAEATPA